MAQQDWDIKPRKDTCCGCNTSFQDQQSYMSRLMFGEQGYMRDDFCDACWKQKDDGNPSYSVWRGIFKAPPPPQEEALKKETAETLLRRLIEAEDDSKRNCIFILTVMLERKKVLVEKDVQIREDGSMLRVYEHKKTGEIFLIADPRLRLDQLEQVQREVLEMLGGPKPAATADVPAGSEPAAPQPAEQPG